MARPSRLSSTPRNKRGRKLRAKKEFWGEIDSQRVIDYLNSPHPGGDTIERLVQLNADVAQGVFRIGAMPGDQIKSLVAEAVSATRLATAPVVVEVGAPYWKVDWRLVGDMDRMQALAFINVLHCASKGVLWRIRRCRLSDCSKWFFARFRHGLFCSEACGKRYYRSSPEYRNQKREAARRYRREQGTISRNLSARDKEMLALTKKEKQQSEVPDPHRDHWGNPFPNPTPMLKGVKPKKQRRRRR